MDVSLQDIQEVSDYIQTLNPKPGSEFESERVQYVVPDLIYFNTKMNLLFH